MRNIGFKNQYSVLHFTPEMGQYVAGGLGTYINEVYSCRKPSTGFVHLYTRHTINEHLYPGNEDLLAISPDELHLFPDVTFEIAVVHFYGLSEVIELFKNKPHIRLIYVIHSVPTTEPCFLNDPFGGNEKIKYLFESICERADWLILISEAEKRKLMNLYPKHARKLTVIYNGIDFTSKKESTTDIDCNEEGLRETVAGSPARRENRRERKVFGYLGRIDYRKGLLDCLRAFRNYDSQLWIASGNEDPQHLSSIMNYIEGAGLEKRVRFLGWCIGARKRTFLQQIDALLIPSLYEPFGYVALEAIREGTPLISSNRGGLAEIIGPYRYSFDPYKTSDLERCLQQFQGDTDSVLHEEMKSLHSRCVHQFSAQKMVNNYDSLFRKLLNQVTHRQQSVAPEQP